MLNFLKPAKHIERLENSQIDPTYKRLRIQVYLGIFIGYAAFYLTRKVFTLVIPELEKQGFGKGELGVVLGAVSIAYGLSKFLMGNVSDRSNSRYFLASGLLLTALVAVVFGIIPYSSMSVPTAITIMFILMFFNGWFQGMGWPPCGRAMVHWWSSKERGAVVSTWNCAHNVGGGLAGNIAVWALGYFNHWQAMLYVPAGIVVGVAIFVILVMRDTPQSCGLPPIEEYKNDYPKDYSNKNEIELKAKEIFVKYILPNKFLWYIAIANAFVYFIRYGALDWAPSYLSQVKHFELKSMGWAYALYEYAAIPGTILCGIISDKIFKGRRTETGLIFMVLTLILIVLYWSLPSSTPKWVITCVLAGIGFLIYGPVMLIGLHALELAPKKAAGTAAGFTGLFGYLGGSTLAGMLLGYVIEYSGWDMYFILLIVSSLLAIFFIALTYTRKKD